MAFVFPAVMAGISGLAGLFGGRPKTTTYDASKTGTLDQTETPVLSPEQYQILARLMPALFSRMQSPDLGGYETTGMANINKGYNIRNKALQNILAAKGLNASPLAGSVMAGSEASRINDIVNFRNQIPLQRYQLQGETLGQLGSLFSALPTGRHLAGTSSETMSGKQVGSGDMLGGLLSGLGSGLAATWGYNWAKGQPTWKP